ncbi:hypothetical protein B6U91_00925 [Candidatus Pacearchaeota archaeon ex4484_71]|nr:MAG: hypothetical protein B6U91_00925 [Candidatus Pacearchaeota archaeon ex4484_71]
MTIEKYLKRIPEIGDKINSVTKIWGRIYVYLELKKEEIKKLDLPGSYKGKRITYLSDRKVIPINEHWEYRKKEILKYILEHESHF